MNISIIGTNGLLSTSIAKYCNSDNFELNMYGVKEPVSHSFTTFKHIDLVNEQLDCVELLKSDVIVYCVGAGIQSTLKEKSDLIYHLNVTVPVQICNSLKELGYVGYFMTFGSYFEIGETSSDSQFSEIDMLQSQEKAPNDYTISKRMLSRFLSSFTAPFTRLHFVLPTIYGESESVHRLIPYTLKSIEENTALSFTSGEQIRQYIYINDLVKILFRAVEVNLESGIYNVTGVEELSVKELVTMLFNLKGKPLPENIFGKTERADVGMKVLKLNGEKLQKGVGFTPTTKISEVYSKYNFQ